MKKILATTATAAALAIPGISFGATYAYVNVSGDVQTMTANDPNTAIATAPSIHPRSGVLLIDSEADEEVLEEDVTVSGS